MSIRKLSDRDHLILRPAMYVGSVDSVKNHEYIFEENKIVYKEIQYVPALIKIINEIIDNSVDVAIKSNFKSCSEISVKMTAQTVEVTDNGTGIPITQNEDGDYLPMICWGCARAGSNFDDDANRTQIGMNGVGSYATNCFSKKFIGKSDDGEKSYTITFKNNAESYTEKVDKTSNKTGVNVKFWPDLEKFHLTEIDDIHMSVIKQRLINLSMSFPEITFKFNSRKINVSSFKKYVSLFNETSEIYETENYKFAFLPNADDDFRQFSYVNGLKIPDGGTHIDILSTQIVNRIRDKLGRKYKTIKPADIRNRLMLIVFMKNVKNTKFNSQSKEKITNSIAEINNYFGDIDYDKIANKMFRNKSFVDPITEVYRIKEEFKKRQELKTLSKPTKKIKCEKYLSAIGVKKYLLLCEGQSARGGLEPILGRKECGYFELRGVPLNAYSSNQAKFTDNKELSELFKVIQNENYEYIVFANDADLDGSHIAGLLTGFIERYLPEEKNKICRLITPVKYTSKKSIPNKWSYSLDEDLNVEKGEEFYYVKGLGTFEPEHLKYIISVDGLSKMIDKLEFDSKEILDEWLNDDAEPRKKYILANDFSIARL